MAKMRVENRLELSEKNTVTTYRYIAYSKGDSHYGEELQIEFKNGVFVSATYPFRSPYNAIEWEILEAISKKIKFLTKQEANNGG